MFRRVDLSNDLDVVRRGALGLLRHWYLVVFWYGNKYLWYYNYLPKRS